MAERVPNDAVHDAWLVSLISVFWTVAAGSAAIAIGAAEHSAVLGAFGAIGFVDAVGSAALVYHFHHAKRHAVLAEHLERLAHRVVTAGLFVVGLGALVVGVVRLANGAEGGDSLAGTLLAAASLAVLAVLSSRKHAIAARVGSPALRADGRLSAVGAAQAGIALLGTLAREQGSDTADAIGAAIIGVVAIATAIATRRQG